MGQLTRLRHFSSQVVHSFTKTSKRNKQLLEFAQPSRMTTRMQFQLGNHTNLPARFPAASRFDDIFQFVHCNNAVSSFTKLSLCPLCGEEIPEKQVRKFSCNISRPVRSFSLVIKPTIGNFHGYTSDSLLHIGVSNSQGNFAFFRHFE
jgi:hypothetical protein